MSRTTRAFTILLIEPDNDIASLIIRISKQRFPEAVIEPVGSLDASIEYIQQTRVSPKLIMLAGNPAGDTDDRDDLLAFTRHASVQLIPVLYFEYSGAERNLNRYYGEGIAAYHTKPETLADWQIIMDSIRGFWYVHAQLPFTSPPTDY